MGKEFKGFVTGDTLNSYKFDREEIVEIPNFVKYIDAYAFQDQRCRNVVIPASVVKIGDYAFNGCKRLKSVSFSEGLEEIGGWAFNFCESLSSVTLPSTLKKVSRKEQPFNNCSGLKSIEVASGNSVFRSAGNCLIDVKAKLLLSGCKNSVIPSDGSVTKIGTGAFCRMYGLNYITIPSSVETIGEFAFFNCTGLKKFVFPNGLKSIAKSAFEACHSLEEVQFGSGVEKLGANAFHSCDIKSVDIPDNVTSIGNLAFAYGGIRSLKIGKGLKNIASGAFKHNYQLSSVTLSEGTETIEKDAFLCCENLESIVIPKSVKYIGSRAFRHCIKLSEVTFLNTDTVIADDAFQFCPFQPQSRGAASETDFELDGETLMKYKGSANKVVIPPSITKISGKAFVKNESIEEVVIGSAVTAVGIHAFDGCVNLRKISVESGNKKFRSEGECLIDIKKGVLLIGCNASAIPQGIKEIGSNAFSGRKLLKNAVIPEGVKTIGTGAFSGCSELENAVFPQSLEEICDNAFFNCKKLSGASLKSGLKKIGSEAFKKCSGMKTLDMSEGLETIGYEAFSDCASIEYLHFPEGIKSVGVRCFQRCHAIKSIYIPASLEDIGYDAIVSGPYLESIKVGEGNSKYADWGNCLVWLKMRYGKPEYVVICGCKNSVIPSGKNIIGVKNAFNGCSSLERLVIPEGVEAVYGETFSGCTSLKAIVIPKSMRFGIDLDDCVNLESITLPKDKRELFKDLEGKVNFIEILE